MSTEQEALHPHMDNQPEPVAKGSVAAHRWLYLDKTIEVAPAGRLVKAFIVSKPDVDYYANTTDEALTGLVICYGHEIVQAIADMLEDRADAQAVLKARQDPENAGEPVPWEQVKAEAGL